MKQIRKLVRATKNFKYEVELIELLPNRQTSMRVITINSSQTNVRSLPNVVYEVFDELITKKWHAISEAEYLRTINRHRNPPVIRKRKATTTSVQPLNINQVFHITTHFKDRCRERFINTSNGPYSMLQFVLENGYVIPNKQLPRYKFGPDADYPDHFVIWEPHIRMLVCGLYQNNKFVCKTVIDPDDTTNGQPWFRQWLNNNDYKKNQTVVQWFKDVSGGKSCSQ